MRNKEGDEILENCRILFIVPNLRIGTGVTSVIMNHYGKLIKEGYCVDFCLLQDRESPFFKVVQENGGHIFAMPSGNNGYPDKKKTPYFIEQILKKEKYKIVHIHIVGRFAVYTSYYAKKYQVPFRIYHAHNPRDVHDFKSFVASMLFDNLSVVLNNCYLACSKEAGKSVFRGKNFNVIKNTIDTEKLKYSSLNREKFRKKFDIKKDVFVVGTVCRISYQKNPYYLVDIFEKVQEIKKDSILVWAGSGDLEKNIEQYIESKGLSNKVLLLGDCSDVASLYAAMDVFVLPSRYEGLGIVYIEAQASGLTTFASNVVPKDTKITELINYLPLNESPEFWAKKIASVESDTQDRETYSKIIADAGYDTSLNNDLINYYSRLK